VPRATTRPSGRVERLFSSSVGGGNGVSTWYLEGENGIEGGEGKSIRRKEGKYLEQLRQRRLGRDS
jgi:hypothetical protein